MPRAKSVLWVDDEVEGLAAHRRFLEAQGFTVAAAAHGDDALALLRRQPYSVVLLDEQMPGRRGLELLGEIRAIDPTVPVVMVTQSEDEATLREAIGVEVDDYLVKPVHPRQVLSVVTRLVEGPRLRQQRLARDFVARFRELEGRRGAALAWREWIELVAELARWEVRLAAADEPGLSEALRTLQRSLRQDFAEYVARHYARWVAHPEGDRPPLSVDVGAEFLAPLVERSGRALFVVIDCLRLDQWEVLRDLVAPLFEVEESYYYAILPTATPFARNAIFSGLFPAELAARHPAWWGQPSDEESLNAHEGELLAEQLRDLLHRPVAVRYEKLFGAGDGDLARRCATSRAPGSSARRRWRRCARPSAGASRCCSRPITGPSTASGRPPCSPSATPRPTCATSSARTWRARIRRPRSPWTTCPPSASPRWASGCACCSPPPIASSCIPPSCASTRPAIAARSCTAA